MPIGCINWIGAWATTPYGSNQQDWNLKATIQTHATENSDEKWELGPPVEPQHKEHKTETKAAFEVPSVANQRIENKPPASAKQQNKSDPIQAERLCRVWRECQHREDTQDCGSADRGS
jgi:hypothetical protein